MHECVPHDSFSLSRTRGDNVTFVEGAAFQEHNDGGYSGFNAIWVDLEVQQQKVISYLWKDNCFEPESPNNPWQQFKRGGVVAKRDFILTDECERFLKDAGANYTHPSGLPLSIHDIFVYPDADELELSQRRERNTERSIQSNDFLKFVINKRRLLFLGRERMGKSTLAKVLFAEFYDRDLIPVLVSGHDIKSPSIDKFNDLVHKNLNGHYANPKLTYFDQLNRDQAVVIIDDFDHSRLNAKGRLELLVGLHKRFERICVFSDESIRFEELKEAQEGKVFLSDYTQVQLLEYGYLLRSKLIRKWVEFGGQYTLTAEDIERKITELERQIDQLLKQGYLPSFPFFILVLLQGLMQSGRLRYLGKLLKHFLDN